MLDGIDLYVIDVRGVVPVVTNRMFPKAVLPYAAFALAGTYRG